MKSATGGLLLLIVSQISSTSFAETYEAPTELPLHCGCRGTCTCPPPEPESQDEEVSPSEEATIAREGTQSGFGPQVLRFAKAFEGTPYGDGPGQVVCTSFVETVLGASGVTFDRAQSAKLNVWGVDNNGDRIVDSNEYAAAKAADKISGAPGALVSSGQGVGLGDLHVTEASFQPGDVVQYWYQKQAGSWEGHTGFVERDLGGGRIELFGAHREKGMVTTITVNLTGKDAVFVARPSR